jgi:hypothetical protein
MSEDDFTTQYGVTLRRVDGDEWYNYEVVSRKSGETVARARWLTLQPSGAPLAFGDAPAEVEIGSDTEIRVSVTSNSFGDDDARVAEAAGARIYLGDAA